MPRDIETIEARLRATHPNIVCEQLHVLHPGADDDGIWFFRHPPSTAAVQLESSTGMLPFLVEHDQSPDRAEAGSIEIAVAHISRLLGLR